MFPELQLGLCRSLSQHLVLPAPIFLKPGLPSFPLAFALLSRVRREALAKPGEHPCLCSVLSSDAPQRGWTSL